MLYYFLLFHDSNILRNFVNIRIFESLERTNCYLHRVALESKYEKRARPFYGVRQFSERRIEGPKKQRRTGITDEIQRPLWFKENTPLPDTSLFSHAGASKKINWSSSL